MNKPVNLSDLGALAEASRSEGKVASIIQSKTHGRTSNTEEKVIQMMGQGYTAEIIAATLGITPSRVSQIVSDPAVASVIQGMRFENLQKHNERDDKLDSLEDKLIDSLAQTVSYLQDPMKIAHVFSKVNGAKRRGTSAPEQAVQHQTVINLNLPQVIVQHFSRGANNEITKVINTDGSTKSLVTMQSGELLKRARENSGETYDVLPTQAGTASPNSG